jgi:hypothetical protein
VKSHYELIGVDSSADAETIKKAFRRVITQYHPDKVTHLGVEFQELASIRAAELTTAYKILIDANTRAEYDDLLAHGTSVAPAAPTSPGPADDVELPEAVPPPSRRGSGMRFAADRAGKNDIVRRATLQRVHSALQHAVGDCEFPPIAGFDLACIPRGRSASSRSLSNLLKKQVAPIVLVRILALVDGAAAMEAFGNAVRSRVDTKGTGIALLLIGNQLGPAGDLARAIEDARKKSPTTQDRIFPVPIDMRDWTAKIPLNTPDAIRTLVERLKSAP